MEGIRIQEVNSHNVNFYDSARDTIVLDSKLRQYPEFREIVKQHEIKHALIERSSSSRIESLIRNLWHDIKKDVTSFYESYSGEASEQREEYEYLYLEQDEYDTMHHALGNHFRVLINLGLFATVYPILFWYGVGRDVKKDIESWTKTLFEDDKE